MDKAEMTTQATESTAPTVTIVRYKTEGHWQYVYVESPRWRFPRAYNCDNQGGVIWRNTNRLSKAIGFDDKFIIVPPGGSLAETLAAAFTQNGVKVAVIEPKFKAGDYVIIPSTPFFDPKWLGLHRWCLPWEGV